jgi:photosystem II stability/assembly factor-like uncharacterized protein
MLVMCIPLSAFSENIHSQGTGNIPIPQKEKVTMDRDEARTPIGSGLTFTSVFELGHLTDAFSSIHSLGNGIILAGKRSWKSFAPYKAIYTSTDSGNTWNPIHNPTGLTGSHLYMFGDNGNGVVIAGTGDIGNICLIRSSDYGQTWNVMLSNSQINALARTSPITSIFTAVYMGSDRWLVPIKNLDTASESNIYFLESLDNGVTWKAYPTKGLKAACRNMIKTSDGRLLYAGTFSSNQKYAGPYVSKDEGYTWTQGGNWKAFEGIADLGNGSYVMGTYDIGTSPLSVAIYKSTDYGLSWSLHKSAAVHSTYAFIRSILKVSDKIAVAFTSCSEFSPWSSRDARTFITYDGGAHWVDAGNPYTNTYGGMNAIYEAIMLENGMILAAGQPDSNILRGYMQRE